MPLLIVSDDFFGFVCVWILIQNKRAIFIDEEEHLPIDLHQSTGIANVSAPSIQHMASTFCQMIVFKIVGDHMKGIVNWNFLHVSYLKYY